jgi:hypothetical protein
MGKCCHLAAGLSLLLLLWASSSQGQPPTATTEDERLLLDFKATFANGDEILANWTAGSDSCAWTGIACTGAKKVAIM